MISARSHFFALAAAATLGLSACGGGGGGGAALPAADFTLPAEYSAAGPGAGGMGDYLVPGTGTWRVNLDGQVRATALGSATLTNAMIYDPDLDQWTIDINGRNLVLDFFGGSAYMQTVCTSDCSLFEVYDDDPILSQYGTFGYLSYQNAAGLTEYYVHAGLKTPSADMPATGTGTYAGTFDGLVNTAIGFDYVIGGVDITASFASGGGSLTFDSAGAGSGTYILSGSATISGNTYDGTVSGSYTNGVGTALFSTAGSSLSGAFYGPAADETAGVVYASGSGGDEFAGGFWAGQTLYTIP